MTLKRRIALIATGIIIFAALGPLVVLMAQGYRYDFQKGHLVVTGTLVIKTEPRGAHVSLNGRPASDTPLVKRFLAPKEYLVEIAKPGYFPWRKRVNVFGHQVSFLPEQNEKINLLLSKPNRIKKIDAVADTFAYEDFLFYISAAGNKIFSSSFNSANPALVASTTIDLPDPSFIEARLAGNDAEFLLSSQRQAWHVSADRAFALPALTLIQLGSRKDTVLGLNTKGQLLEITANSSRILKENVLSFRRNDAQIYYLTKLPSGELSLSRMSDAADVKIAIPVPSASSGSIVLSPDNQVYLVLDEDLYSVKDKLEKINGQVRFAYWDTHGNFLVYGNDHEAWVFEELSHSPNRLLTRTTKPAAIPLFHKAAGYTFLIEGNEIKAIESDRSGQPNVYSLLATAAPKKISLNDEGNIMSLLDGTTLLLIQIR